MSVPENRRLPWKAKGANMVCPEGNVVATVWVSPDSQLEVVDEEGAISCANFIARAVNSHDALLAACEVIPPNMLERLAEWLDLKNPDDPYTEVQTDLRKMAQLARSAIAKAKPEADDA